MGLGGRTARENALKRAAEPRQGGAHLFLVDFELEGFANSAECPPTGSPLAVPARRQLEQRRAAIVRMPAPADKVSPLQPSHRIRQRCQGHAELLGELCESRRPAYADQAED